MRPIFRRIYLSDRRRFSFNIGPMSVSSIRVRSRFRSFRSRSFSTRSRIPLWSYHYSILRLGVKMVLIRSPTEFFVLNFEKKVQGAHIRTGQKYEWLVHFCIFCFRPIRAVQNFLTRPLMQKMFSGPSLYGTPLWGTHNFAYF